MPARTMSKPKAKKSKAAEPDNNFAPRKQPSLDRGMRRVESLLAAAEECFAEVGYGAASMNGVARRARASIGSLYQFFPSKESVAAAIIDQYVEELKACWEAIDVSGDPGDYRAFAQELVSKTLEQIDRQPAFSTLEDAQINYGIRPGNHNVLLHCVIDLIGRRAPSTDTTIRQKLGIITFEMLKAAHGVHKNDVGIEGEIDIASEISLIIAGYFRRIIK